MSNAAFNSFALPGVGLSSPLAPGPFELSQDLKIKRDRRCQVDSDPYGLPNWGRPLKGRVNPAPANDNVNPGGLVSVKSYPAQKGARRNFSRAEGLET
jgi:hypothetical protein